MKRALVATVGMLALVAGVESANSQARIRVTPNSGYEWAAGPGPNRRGNDCVNHVDLNRGYGYLTPCPAPKPVSAKPIVAGYQWAAGPGPVRRGTDCVADVDLNRGYGYLRPCPAPKGPAKPMVAGYEWAYGPGPNKRGNQCVVHTDLNRGYGFAKTC
jgi:hypothetical protein